MSSASNPAGVGILAKNFRPVIAISVFAFLLIVLFASVTDYDSLTVEGTASFDSNFELAYGWFQDVHIMVFIGFGYLMVYLKLHGYSSVGFNFLVACLAILWSILTNSFFHQAIGFISSGDHVVNELYTITEQGTTTDPSYSVQYSDGSGVAYVVGTDTTYNATTMANLYVDSSEQAAWHDVPLSLVSLITGDFTAAACLISFGAVLGKVNPTQLVAMVFFECIFFAFNEAIGAARFSVVDMGGSIFVHLFGAIFGVAMSMTLTTKDHKKQAAKRQVPSTNSDLFAMVGSIFLFCFWPSFNGVLASGAGRHRVVINTVVALCGSCITTFVVSALATRSRFSMEHVQNAALAGGVAIGSSADLIVKPSGALAIGMIAGIVSTLGFAYIKPFLEKRIGLHDSCGVLHLHGIPGLIGAIAGAIASIAADTHSTCGVYPATAPTWSSIVTGMENSKTTSSLHTLLGSGCAPSNARTLGQQAGYQLLAAFLTILIASLSGAMTGVVMRSSICNPVDEAFVDAPYWELPEEDLEEEQSVVQASMNTGSISSPKSHKQISPA